MQCNTNRSPVMHKNCLFEPFRKCKIVLEDQEVNLLQGITFSSRQGLGGPHKFVYIVSLRSTRCLGSRWPGNSTRVKKSPLYDSAQTDTFP